MLAGERAPLLAGAPREDPLTAAWASEPGASNWLLHQVLAPDALAPGLPELGLQRAQRDIAVGARVGPVADVAPGERELPARGARRSARRLGGDHGQPRQRAVEHRAVDELTLAGALALAQRDSGSRAPPSAPRRRGRRSGPRPGPAAPSRSPVRPRRPFRPR